MTLLYILFNAFAVVGLLVGAMGALSASKAHRNTAKVCREMQATWEAISHAQSFIRYGRHDEANRELDHAAKVILASRRRREAASASVPEPSPDKAPIDRKDAAATSKKRPPMTDPWGAPSAAASTRKEPDHG